jgi:hypothetical protein
MRYCLRFALAVGTFTCNTFEFTSGVWHTQARASITRLHKAPQQSEVSKLRHSGHADETPRSTHVSKCDTLSHSSGQAPHGHLLTQKHLGPGLNPGPLMQRIRAACDSLRSSFQSHADKGHTCERSRNPNGSLTGADSSTARDADFWDMGDVFWCAAAPKATIVALLSLPSFTMPLAYSVNVPRFLTASLVVAARVTLMYLYHVGDKLQTCAI